MRELILDWVDWAVLFVMVACIGVLPLAYHKGKVAGYAEIKPLVTKVVDESYHEGWVDGFSAGKEWEFTKYQADHGSM